MLSCTPSRVVSSDPAKPSCCTCRTRHIYRVLNYRLDTTSGIDTVQAAVLVLGAGAALAPTLEGIPTLFLYWVLKRFGRPLTGRHSSERPNNVPGVFLRDMRSCTGLDQAKKARKALF